MQSILYTPTSGIWRTVWLEPVPVQHITRVDMIPDIDKKLVSVTVQGSTDAVGLELKFQAADASGKVVAVVTGRVGRTFQAGPAHMIFCRCMLPIWWLAIVHISPGQSSSCCHLLAKASAACLAAAACVAWEPGI